MKHKSISTLYCDSAYTKIIFLLAWQEPIRSLMVLSWFLPTDASDYRFQCQGLDPIHTQRGDPHFTALDKSQVGTRTHRKQLSRCGAVSCTAFYNTKLNIESGSISQQQKSGAGEFTHCTAVNFNYRLCTEALHPHHLLVSHNMSTQM